MNPKTVIVTSAFALALCGLMAVHIADPWQFSNDDNGAWFSAVARTHLNAGLRATRGQDFFTSRETGAIIPYLHHPPLPGLLLATAFGATGVDSPCVARTTFAVLHLFTFVVIACMGIRVLNANRHPVPYAYALAVAATVPMSTFYGKMPNHEAPGLLFFSLGVLAWGFPSPARSPGRPFLALTAWFLAILASWHAGFCVVAWLLTQGNRKQPLRSLLPLTSVLLMVGLVVLHMRWAANWQAVASQQESVRHWSLAGGGISLRANLGYLRHAAGIGMALYAYLPVALAAGWLVRVWIVRFRTGEPLPEPIRGILGLGAGSAAYALLFPRAMNNHAYQGFYLIPFVALASAKAMEQLADRPVERMRPAVRRAIPAAILVTTCLLGVGLTLNKYRKASAAAVRAAADIRAQYR